MKQASKYAYIKAPKSKASSGVSIQSNMNPDQRRAYEEDEAIDTNVISIDFKNLKESEENLQMGDPYFCKKCQCCLSSISTIYSKLAYQTTYYSKPQDPNQVEEEKLDEKSEFSHKEKIALENIQENDKIWVCEFCGNHNVLAIETEEIPTKQDIVYITQSANQVQNSTQSDSDHSVIFCIDNSGSMSVTHEVQGKHDLKHGLSEEEYNMLKQFIEVGADQYLPGQKKNTTYISRKQCVLAAIENQVIEMKKEFPNRKVGLVTFNDEVCVIGDGKEAPETIAGDKLGKYDVCLKAGEESYTKLMSHSVKDSADALITKFQKLEEKGKTALGPGLIVSIAMAAQGKPGSKVILCTDGLANVGLGEMDTQEGLIKANEFYTQCAEYAKVKGVSVSVISIKGEGCKLEVLGKLADETTGELTRVDPSQITNNFANILKDEVLGTGLVIKLRLHKALKFRNEPSSSLSENGTICTREIGNVTKNTELTFEYDTKNDEELSALGIDPTLLKTVPFQALINYTSGKGDKLLRIITQQQKTTDNLQVAEQEANMKLLACRALQQQAYVAQKGDYEGSAKVSSKWGNYLETNVMKNTNDRASAEIYTKYQQRNTKLSSAVINKNTRESKPKSTFDMIPESSFKKEESFAPKSIPTTNSYQPNFKAPPSKPSFQSKPQPQNQKMSLGASKPMMQANKMAAPKSKEMEKSKKLVEKVMIEPESEPVLDADDEDADYEVIHQNKNLGSDWD